MTARERGDGVGPAQGWRRRWGWTSAALAAVAAAHLPLLLSLAKRLWAAEHYQYFPLVLVGAGVIAYDRLADLPPLEVGRPFWRRSLIAGAFLLLGLAVLVGSNWLAGIAAMASLWALLYALGGRTLLVRWLLAWLFLWLAIPLPFRFDTSLIHLLQKGATNWASGVLDLIGLRHAVAGVVLELPERSFFIEEACSGIHSLFAALACTIFYAIYLRRRVHRAIALVLAAVFWVIIVNALRVALVTILASRWNLPVTEGWGHDAIGVVLFVVIMVLVVSTDRLLLFFVPSLAEARKSEGRKKKRRRETGAAEDHGPGRGDEKAGGQSRPPAAGDTHRDGAKSRLREIVRLGRPTAVGLTVSFGLLLCAQAAIALHGTQPIGVQTDVRQLTRCDAEMLPASWRGWERIGFDTVTREVGHPEGRISRIWKFRKGERQVSLSINGSYRGWHPFSLCLEGQGWLVHERNNHSYKSIGEDLPGGFTELKATMKGDRYAYALFAHFDEQNRPVGPPFVQSSYNVRMWLARVADLLKGRLPARGEIGESQGRLTYQLQAFAERFDPLSLEEEAEVRELFHFARRKVTGGGDLRAEL